MKVNIMFYNLNRLMPPIVRGGADKVGGGVVRFDESKYNVLQSQPLNASHYQGRVPTKSAEG